MEGVDIKRGSLRYLANIEPYLEEQYICLEDHGTDGKRAPEICSSGALLVEE